MSETGTFQALPALRSLGRLADALPVIVTDTREQTPLVFRRLPSITATLPTADYGIAGFESLPLFGIERKTVADLTACVGPERLRFERELARLRAYRFKRLLIVGKQADIEAGRYRSAIIPSAVLASLETWEIRFDIPFVFEPNPEAAARRVEDWAYRFAVEIVKESNALFRGSRIAPERQTAQGPGAGVEGKPDTPESRTEGKANSTAPTATATGAGT
jgi:ERCC4-type nuclease